MGNWPSMRDGSRRAGPHIPGVDPLEDRRLLSQMPGQVPPPPPPFFAVASIESGVALARVPGVLRTHVIGPAVARPVDSLPAGTSFEFERSGPAGETLLVPPLAMLSDDSAGGGTFFFRGDPSLPQHAERAMAIRAAGGTMMFTAAEGSRRPLGPPDPLRNAVTVMMAGSEGRDRSPPPGGRDGMFFGRGEWPSPGRQRAPGPIGLVMAPAPGAEAPPIAPPQGDFAETLLSYGPVAVPNVAMQPRDGAIAINGMSGPGSASLLLATPPDDSAGQVPGIPAGEEVRSPEAGLGAAPRGGRPIEVPSPVGEGLITSFSPFGLSPALEESVSRFLAGIEGLGLPVARGANFPSLLLPIAAAIGAFKAWQRFRDRKSASTTPNTRGKRRPLDYRLS
jgi:hypothetical protein